MTNDELIQSLKNSGVLHTDRIVAAFRTQDRLRFVPDSERVRAYADIPLPLGHGATISQPYTVAAMLELLQPKPGERCLDVGAGSGWTAAILSAIVGPTGRVTAIERLPQLARPAQQHLAEVGATSVRFVTGDASRGWREDAPYDIIHVAAAADTIPTQIVSQLSPGGRLVIPVGPIVQDLVLLTKKEDNTITERRLAGFQFVPLVSQPPTAANL